MTQDWEGANYNLRRRSSQSKPTQYGHVSYARKCKRCKDNMYNLKRTDKRLYCTGCEGVMRLENTICEKPIDKT